MISCPSRRRNTLILQPLHSIQLSCISKTTQKQNHLCSIAKQWGNELWCDSADKQPMFLILFQFSSCFINSILWYLCLSLSLFVSHFLQNILLLLAYWIKHFLYKDMPVLLFSLLYTILYKYATSHQTTCHTESAAFLTQGSKCYLGIKTQQ